MTKNQIDALRYQEEVRANRVRERQNWWELPVKYISAAGQVVRGIGGLSGFKSSGNKFTKGGSKGNDKSLDQHLHFKTKH